MAAASLSRYEAWLFLPGFFIATGRKRAPALIALLPIITWALWWGGIAPKGTYVLDIDPGANRISRLVYLASKYDAARTWYPDDAKSMGEIQQWLAYAGNEILNTLAPARAIAVGLRSGNLAEAQEKARGTLAHLEGSLSGRQWLAAGHPTVADIACYPYAGLIGQADIAVDNYPAVAAWCQRIQKLTGYVTLPARPVAKA